MVRRTRAESGDNLFELAKQLRVIKDEKSRIEARAKEVSDRLKSLLDEHGEEDDKGHLVYELPEEVDGVKRLIKQRKVQTTLDEESLEAYLATKGLRDEVISTKEFLDGDKVANLIFDKKLTEAEFAQHVKQKVTWALQEGK